MQPAIDPRPRFIPHRRRALVRQWLSRRMPRPSVSISGALHLALVLGILSGLRFAPHIAPYRLPGLHNGVRTLTYFTAGSTQPAPVQPPAAKAPVVKAAVASAPAQGPAAPSAAAPAADRGVGDSARSGIGDGNLNIALPRVFPYPNADLSALPRGTSGDVILNAVIDEQGRIQQLTLVQGLGPSIDQAVIATVQGWSYAPATRDGVPVRSEQELRFHYERRA